MPQIPRFLGHTKAGGVTSVVTPGLTPGGREHPSLFLPSAGFLYIRVTFVSYYSTRPFYCKRHFPGGFKKKKLLLTRLEAEKLDTERRLAEVGIRLGFPLPVQGSLTGRAELMRSAWSRFPGAANTHRLWAPFPCPVTI